METIKFSCHHFKCVIKVLVFFAVVSGIEFNYILSIFVFLLEFKSISGADNGIYLKNYLNCHTRAKFSMLCIIV